MRVRAGRCISVLGVGLMVNLILACGSSSDQPTSLCGPQGSLRVGYVGSGEGRTDSAADLITDPDLERMRTLLTLASRCDVQFEPLLSPERARQRLIRGEWDLAFLPPGLTAMAMQRGVDDQPIRKLVRPNRSRSALLVRRDSGLNTNRSQWGASRSLPRGSLTGFYLPLYNLHGLKLKEVRYANSFDALLAMLRAGDVDVIAWDSGAPRPGDDVLVLAEDDHEIPDGAMVLSQALAAGNYKPMLQVLDDSVGQMPKSLGYSSGVLPQVEAYHGLREIVRHVEGWTLPLDGQPYSVYGTGAQQSGGRR